MKDRAQRLVDKCCYGLEAAGIVLLAICCFLLAAVTSPIWGFAWTAIGLGEFISKRSRAHQHQKEGNQSK